MELMTRAPISGAAAPEPGARPVLYSVPAVGVLA